MVYYTLIASLYQVIAMGVFNFIPFLGRNEEKRTIELLKEDMNLVYEIVCELNSLFAAFKDGDESVVVEKRDSIDSVEHQVDGLRRQIEESLYSGAFMPISRGRILDFAEKIDDIADVTQDTAHMTSFITKDLRVPEVDGMLGEHINKTCECVMHLKDAVNEIDDGRKIRDLIKKVEDAEHEVDLIERRIFHSLYNAVQETKPLLLYSKLIEFAGEISNTAEDASDMLSLLLLMHKP